MGGEGRPILLVSGWVETADPTRKLHAIEYGSPGGGRRGVGFSMPPPTHIFPVTSPLAPPLIPDDGLANEGRVPHTHIHY